MKRFSLSKSSLFVALSIAVFAACKLATLHFRFGDENVYFYMSKAILSGSLPYRDFFLADPPFFVYFMAGFKTLIGGHLILFKAIPIVFDSASAVLTYLILKKLGNSLAAVAPALYLFSFTVLSTSDYVTGAEVLVFLMLAAIYADMKGRPVWSGVFWALACLSKLYAAPALIGYLAYKFLKKEFPSARKIILGGIAASLIALLPFFIIAPHATLYDLILHQLRRPDGLDKWTVIGTFLSFEWLLVLGVAAGAYLADRENDALRFILPLALSAAFFLWYRDLYYLYLHLLLPFLVILSVLSLDHLKRIEPEIAWGMLGLYALIAIYPIWSYASVYRPQGMFNDPQEIAAALADAPKDYPVYGVQEVAPLTALMSGRTIFESKIDTNTQNFAAGTHDRGQISKDAVAAGIYLVARVADYPDQGVSDTGFEGYFDPALFRSSCTVYKKFPRPTPGDELNDIAIYACKAN